MGGKMDKLGGKAKEAAGTVSGDDSLRREGKADQFKGDVKETASDAKDAIGDAFSDAKDGIKEEGIRADERERMSSDESR